MADVQPACLYLALSNAGCSGLSDSSIIFKTQCFVLFGVFSVPVINKMWQNVCLNCTMKAPHNSNYSRKVPLKKKSTWLVKKHFPIKKNYAK